MRYQHDLVSPIAGVHLRLLLALVAQGFQQASFATAASVTLTANGEWDGRAGAVLSSGTLGAGGDFNTEWAPPQRLTRREDAPLQYSLLSDVQQETSSTSTTAPQVSLTLTPRSPFDLSDKLVSADEEESNEDNFGYKNSTYWEDRRWHRYWTDAVWSISLGMFALTGLVFLIVVFASARNKEVGNKDPFASRSGLQQQIAEGGATTDDRSQSIAQQHVAEPKVRISNAGSTEAETNARISNAGSAEAEANTAVSNAAPAEANAASSNASNAAPAERNTTVSNAAPAERNTAVSNAAPVDPNSPAANAF
mmetsp:Transcript_16242/g.31811  ORF Transcript_16242/g.31811 Transcript_16242/m.31811 type:complete len:309 (-) Transcript_16242:89-1015(-)